MQKLAISFLAFVSVLVGQAQSISQKNLLDAWDRMSKMVIETTRKMPAEHFKFAPTEEIATYGQLVDHTASANFMFGPTVNQKGEIPEIDTSDKKAVIDKLETSFEFIRKGIKNLSDEQLAEEMEWFGSRMTRLNAILTMTDHLQREYGKNITYVRLKGVAPARSGGW